MAKFSGMQDLMGSKSRRLEPCQSHEDDILVCLDGGLVGAAGTDIQNFQFSQATHAVRVLVRKLTMRRAETRFLCRSVSMCLLPAPRESLSESSSLSLLLLLWNSWHSQAEARSHTPTTCSHYMNKFPWSACYKNPTVSCSSGRSVWRLALAWQRARDGHDLFRRSQNTRRAVNRLTEAMPGSGG